MTLFIEMTGSHKRTRHVVKEDFCICLGIFRHVQKNRVLFGETPKKEGLRVHVIRTLSFFPGKSDFFEMRKTKKIHQIGPCSQADVRSGAADARPVTIRNVKNT